MDRHHPDSFYLILVAKLDEDIFHRHTPRDQSRKDRCKYLKELTNWFQQDNTPWPKGHIAHKCRDGSLIKNASTPLSLFIGYIYVFSCVLFPLGLSPCLTAFTLGKYEVLCFCCCFFSSIVFILQYSLIDETAFLSTVCW